MPCLKAAIPARYLPRAMLAGGLAVLSVATGCNEISDLFFEEWSEEDLNATWERGDAIVAALEEYRSKNARYPKTLQDLVPDYMPEVPSPVVGGPEWVYQVREEDQVFDLGFGTPDDLGEPYSVYSSDYTPGTWSTPFL